MGFVFLFKVRLNGLSSMSINKHIKLNIEEIIDEMAKKLRKQDILL